MQASLPWAKVSLPSTGCEEPKHHADSPALTQCQSMIIHNIKAVASITLLGLLQVIKSEGLIYMVLEYGDIDLARLLQRHEAAQKEGGCTELDENFIRLYWQQMLQARPHSKLPLRFKSV